MGRSRCDSGGSVSCGFFPMRSERGTKSTGTSKETPMDARIALYYMCSTAGLVMIGGGIWLNYKQKIYIDREWKRPVEINTPRGNFKSNYPALVVFARSGKVNWKSRLR
jgi:hypothetical protein